MEELKNWVIDQLTYWNNFDPRNVCYGPSWVEVQQKQVVLTSVLEKIREIETGKGQEGQLPKAREIITSLLNVFVYDNADDEMDAGHIDTKMKAEQFLKEAF